MNNETLFKKVGDWRLDRQTCYHEIVQITEGGLSSSKEKLYGIASISSYRGGGLSYSR